MQASETASVAVDSMGIATGSNSTINVERRTGSAFGTAQAVTKESVLAGSRDTVAGCSTLHLRRAARAASHILDQHLAPLGIRSTQFGMLSAISKHGVIHMTALADYLVLDRTTLTRNLAIMARDGLVTLEPGEDRRMRQIALTEQGRRLLKSARPHWAAGEAVIRTQLGTSSWNSLMSLLQGVAEMIPTGPYEEADSVV